MRTKGRALAGSDLGGYMQRMSTNAQAILERINALSAEDRREVCDTLLQLEARRAGWEEQKVKLREMQSRHAGSGLLQRLLDERAKERARG